MFPDNAVLPFSGYYTKRTWAAECKLAAAVFRCSHGFMRALQTDVLLHYAPNVVNALFRGPTVATPVMYPLCD